MHITLISDNPILEGLYPASRSLWYAAKLLSYAQTSSGVTMPRRSSSAGMRKLGFRYHDAGSEPDRRKSDIDCGKVIARRVCVRISPKRQVRGAGSMPDCRKSDIDCKEEPQGCMLENLWNTWAGYDGHV